MIFELYNDFLRRRREASSGNHTIEVGSGHFDRINQLDYGSYCSGEEKVSEKLREAMNDIEIDCDRRICKYFSAHIGTILKDSV